MLSAVHSGNELRNDARTEEILIVLHDPTQGVSTKMKAMLHSTKNSPKTAFFYRQEQFATISFGGVVAPSTLRKTKHLISCTGECETFFQGYMRIRFMYKNLIPVRHMLCFEVREHGQTLGTL